MTTVTQGFRCANCLASLPHNHTGPCPKCGKEGREIGVVASESIEVLDSTRWQTRREYYQKNPGIRAIVIAITVLAPFLGLFFVGWAGVAVGLVFGGITDWISPWAATKIIEISRG
ncbi:MAG: hypothetical protein E3K38_13000 [Candidatus Kuenenia stuttgartiensis]|nr:hypothetical protein [Candidatus Kuenenia stuttgartiensis]